MFDKKKKQIQVGDLIKVKVKPDAKGFEYKFVTEQLVKPGLGIFYRLSNLDLKTTFIDIQDDNQMFDNFEIIQGNELDSRPKCKPIK